MEKSTKISKDCGCGCQKDSKTSKPMPRKETSKPGKDAKNCK